MRGNAIASRRCGSPQIQAIVRSRPMPKPEWTKVPYRRRSRYHSYAAGSSPSSTMRCEQLVVIVLALAAADDLAVALGCEQIVAEHRARVARILLHVESLRFLRIVHHEHGPIVVRHDQGLVLCAKVLAPLRRAALAMQQCDRLAVFEPVERRLDRLELREIALELRRAPPSTARARAAPSGRRGPPAAACCRSSRSTRPPARSSRTRSDAGASSTSRRGRSGRRCRSFPRRPQRPRHRAAPFARGRRSPRRSSRWRRVLSALRWPP